MLKFDNELFENYADMLLYAIEKRIIKKPLDIIGEIDMEPEDYVQTTEDFGCTQHVCDCFLEYEEVSDQ